MNEERFDAEETLRSSEKEFVEIEIHGSPTVSFSTLESVRTTPSD
jgi:hypothetical protein